MPSINSTEYPASEKDNYAHLHSEWATVACTKFPVSTFLTKIWIERINEAFLSFNFLVCNKRGYEDKKLFCIAPENFCITTKIDFV